MPGRTCLREIFNGMLRIRLVCSLVLAALAFPLGGLEKNARPEAAGLAADRLARITSAMQADLEAGRIPGALAVIARKGKIAYLESVGWADREQRKPIRPDTIFRIYSMTKPIVSAGLMMLYEEGKFSLKDPVSRYIPQLAKLKVWEGGAAVPAKREITIQDLLRHTAGLTYGFFSEGPVDEMYKDVKPLDAPNLDDFITRLAKLPLRQQPGSLWHYSVAVDVQGKLIEVLSGMPLDRYLAERIFRPLAMADTGFAVPPAKRHRFAQMYVAGKQGLELAPASSSARFFDEGHKFFSGGGGLVSTASDYLAFCQMMLNGGQLNGIRLLSRKTVELMTADHLSGIAGRNGTGYGFGLGVAVHTDVAGSGLNGSTGEYNWSGLAGTRFWVDPKEQLIGLYLIQVLPPRNPDPGVMFKQLVYQSIID